MSELTFDEITDAAEIRKCISKFGAYKDVFVPEFTWRGPRQTSDIRIDSLLIDTHQRWIRGFEIKVSRQDFQGDQKWHLYTEFCSSLSIACPKGLIKREEVKPPFGLLYCWKEKTTYGNGFNYRAAWEKKPTRFQQKDGLAWMWTYLRVIETELPRLASKVAQ